MVKSKMPNRSKRYPPEFHRQLVELHRAGRKISELSREFGVSEWAITRWVKQAARDAGRGDGGLTTAERQELVRLRRENRQLKIEREILAKAATLVRQSGDRAQFEALFGFVRANQDTLPSLEAEALDRNRFRTRQDARREIFSWLAGWYNIRRRHSGVGYLSPQEYERRSAQNRRRPSAAFASDSPAVKPMKRRQQEVNLRSRSSPKP
jgi:transposase